MGVQTRTKVRVALTFLKTCFAEETSIAPLFKISILSSRSDALALRVRGAIFLGVRRTSRAMGVENKGRFT